MNMASPPGELVSVIYGTVSLLPLSARVRKLNSQPCWTIWASISPTMRARGQIGIIHEVGLTVHVGCSTTCLRLCRAMHRLWLMVDGVHIQCPCTFPCPRGRGVPRFRRDNLIVFHRAAVYDAAHHKRRD